MHRLNAEMRFLCCTWFCVSSREVQMVAHRWALGGGGRISPSGRKHSSLLWWFGASSCRQPRKMPAYAWARFGQGRWR